MIPAPWAIAAVFAVLVGAGFVLFWPGALAWPRPRELSRLASKYGVFLLSAFLVLALHLLLVQADAGFTVTLGSEEAVTRRVTALEGDLVPSLVEVRSATLDVAFSVAYLVVHPFTIGFTIILFTLTDDERAARATYLAFPLAYALVLPFYIFFPVTNVHVARGLAPPVFEVLPELAAAFYKLTTQNNSFPSLHVAVAALLWNAGRYSRNRAYRYYLAAYFPTVVLASLYLQIHWMADVVGGLAVGLVVGTFIDRITKPQRLALRRVKPEPEEAQRVREAAERLVEHARERGAALGLRGDPVLVGSVAKDTYLRDKVDLDVFWRFPVDVPRAELERRGLELGRAILTDGEGKYAEHPYIRGTWDGYAADVVPCYAVDSPHERMTAVDRTPFHTEYVLKRMSRDQRDEARLLKQFCRGVGVYGAEAKVRGFSGYLCELLVLKHGTFEGVVRAGARWRPGTYLVLETIENPARFHDPLVVLDPVDPARNAASAVSDESLRRFAEAAAAYVDRPGMPFFFPRQRVPLHPEEAARVLARRRGSFLLVTAERPDVLEDHLHDQMRKMGTAVEALLGRHGFAVLSWSYGVEPRLSLLLEVAAAELPAEEPHTGPPVAAREHAERFRKAWQENPDALSPVWEDKGRLFVKRRREFRRADDLIRARLPTLDAGKHVTRALRDGFEIVMGPAIASERTAALLTEHLDPRLPWEH